MAEVCMLSDPSFDEWWDQQIVCDLRDFLGITPRSLELRELTRERAALELLVRRHFQGESTLRRQVCQRDSHSEALGLSDAGETRVPIKRTEKLDRFRNFTG